MDVDSQIKQYKEGRAFGWPDTDRILCRRCLKPVSISGYDINDDPIHDALCSDCIRSMVRAWRLAHKNDPPPIQQPEPLETCKFCRKAKPLLGVWCGPCAILYNERARDNEWAPKEEAETRIAYFKERMKILADPDPSETS